MFIYGAELYLHARRVYEVDSDRGIVTMKGGTAPVRYTFNESVKEYHKLKDLYTAVRIYTNLDKFKVIFKDMNKED